MNRTGIYEHTLPFSLITGTCECLYGGFPMLAMAGLADEMLSCEVQNQPAQV